MAEEQEIVKATIILDTREDKLKEIFDSRAKERELEYTFETQDVGDIIIKRNDDIVFFIERKTIKDLSSSIKSKRWREQKSRLFAEANSRAQIIVLIEGNLKKKEKHLLPYRTLIKALTNSLVRDGIQVYRTMDIEETADFIECLIESLNNELCYYLDEAPQPETTDYVNNIKACKKENLTPENCFISMLMQVPGLSSDRAKAVACKFTSMQDLCADVEIYGTRNLENIKVNATRKLGNKVSENIVKFLTTK